MVRYRAEEAVLLGDRILVLTSTPGKVRRMVDNPAAGSRHTASAVQVQRAVDELLAG